MSEKKCSGGILVERGVIDHATAELIEAERLLTHSRFLSAAVAHGHVSETEALRVLAVQGGVPVVDVARAVLDTRVIKLVPFSFARQHLVLPLRCDGPHLIVAMADANVQSVVDEMSFTTGKPVLPYAALYDRLQSLIPEAYAATSLYYRGPLAPEAVKDQEYVPIIGDEPPLTTEVEIVAEDIVEYTQDIQAASASSAIAVDVDVSDRRRLVLVVEDDVEIAALITAAVGQMGYEVKTANRGTEALHCIRDLRPDLIILDAMLPEVHGFEICRKVKSSKRFANTPVLMVSAVYRGWRMGEDIKATYRADAFLEKPFRLADLRHWVSRLLADAQTDRVGGEHLEARAGDLVQQADQALKSGDTTKALDWLRQAEALDPFSAAIQFLIATALERADRAFQAIYHYERAIELEPAHFAAARNAAKLYQARGFIRKATDLWERALRAAPDGEVRQQIKQHLVSLL